jgi:N-acetyl-anhydromuramyl-L-alanine amidase AmpD
MKISYVPGTASHTSGRQSSVSRIVMHGTVSPCVRGGARSVARYFQSPKAGGSAHYTVDPGEVIRSYAEDVVCWHAPPNRGSIGVELCDPQKGAASRWQDADHQAMLALAAQLVREIADRWDVPLVRLSPADLRAGKRGITGHVDVAKAFGQTDHSDPGTGFPWGQFMTLLKGDNKPEPTWTEALVDELPQLRPGAKGVPVKRAYYLLASHGSEYALDPAVYDDMTYTPPMVERVKKLQKAKGLDADGIVGKLTWTVLIKP